MTPLLLSLCLAATQPPEKKENAIPREVEDVVHATVLVTSDSTDYRQGTGVTIGIQDNYAYVLTAAHVLGQDSNLRVEFITKKSAPKLDPDWKAMPGEVAIAAKRTVADFAILKVLIKKKASKDASPKDSAAGKEEPKPDKADYPGIARLAPAMERPKRFPAKAYAVGFNKPEKDEDTPTATVTNFNLIGKKIKYADQSATGDLAIVWVAEVAGGKGRSGGPLLDEKGQIIGVCMGEEGSRGVYTHLDEIHAYMRKNGFTSLLEGK